MIWVFSIYQNVLGDQTDTGSSGILKRASPTRCPGMNGQLTGGFMHLETKNPVKQGELAISLKTTQGWNVPQTERQLFPSSHIPVPRNRYALSAKIYKCALPSCLHLVFRILVRIETFAYFIPRLGHRINPPGAPVA